MPKLVLKLVNLNVDYNFTLVEMGVNFVTFVIELELLSFLVLMSLGVPRGNHKGKNNLLLIF